MAAGAGEHPREGPTARPQEQFSPVTQAKCKPSHDFSGRWRSPRVRGCCALVRAVGFSAHSGGILLRRSKEPARASLSATCGERRLCWRREVAEDRVLGDRTRRSGSRCARRARPAAAALFLEDRAEPSFERPDASGCKRVAHAGRRQRPQRPGDGNRGSDRLELTPALVQRTLLRAAFTQLTIRAQGCHTLLRKQLGIVPWLQKRALPAQPGLKRWSCPPSSIQKPQLLPAVGCTACGSLPDRDCRQCVSSALRSGSGRILLR